VNKMLKIRKKKYLPHQRIIVLS